MRPYTSPCMGPIQQHLFLHGIITDETCQPVYARLVQGPVAPANSFTVHINSAGGDCDAAFALVHAIFQSPFCVTTVGAGAVASAALDVFIAGHVRNMAKSATALLHCATIGAAQASARKALRNLEIERGFELWRQCSNIKSRDEYDALFTRKDKWVSASDLHALGAVDNLL